MILTCELKDDPGYEHELEVALKRLSLPASGQTAFTKRIMKIVGEV